MKEGIDMESSLLGTELSEQEPAEKECDDKDGETADEGLPPSKGSEDESEEESEGQKELSLLETPQEDFIDIPELSAQVVLQIFQQEGTM